MNQQLLVFITVAEEKNFSQAANKLHMTQPAVSRYIKTLEEQLNTKLLDRNNKKVCLTKPGEVVFHHAKEILALYTRMDQLVDEMVNTASGKLSIGSSYTFGEYVLPHIIAKLRERYPKIIPQISIGNTRDVVEQVAERELDVGIIEGDMTHDKLFMERFADDSMVVVASANHPLTTRSKVDFSELANETWIIREEGSGTREVTDRMFETHYFSPEHVMEFGSTQIIKESVEAGLGISFLSSWTIRKELMLGTLRQLEIEDFPVKREFTLVTQAGPYETKAVKVFLDLLRRVGPTLRF